MYWVYIIECKDGTLYTGITTDVTRRFEEHKKGAGARYTCSHGVKKLVYTEKCLNRSAASKREAAIKKMSRSRKKELFST